MTDKTYKIGIVGVGKIARDQHIPSISENAQFDLVATASRNAQVGGIHGYQSLEELLAAVPDVDCISLCTPPQARYDDARRALLAGKHVMLEKPPGATLSEVNDLFALARKQGVTLFATWHSRFADYIPAAKEWLEGKTVRKIEMIWKEDVRRWHPGQEWIWEAGGLGVFDPGINGLSALTEIYPSPLHIRKADLMFPANRDTPIAASLVFGDPNGAEVTAEFDWRQDGDQFWDIHFTTDQGTASIRDGGARFIVDGEVVGEGLDHEYGNLYARFAKLLDDNAIDVDLSPLTHVADAFMLGRRQEVAAFNW
ncbi:Gfo/Idh/MocA family protein [Falsihalocynthiibacter sp. SS001]|uniref:Gfo/Idh/MocA family protein n=1 Tax=Falsihalocynthiibacter sp. SS001 TaxID=3349698 RepID=UPI0036D3C6B4